MWIIDDISPLRALTPQVMNEEAGFITAPPAVQWMEANGGWPEGSNSYLGPERPNEASIPYYQRTRHIFGDLKIEIFDQQGKLVDTVTSSKHRGVNRATWSMHLKAPKVPPAASALFAASIGPRVLPGTYTVKMTKGEKVYTTPLNVVLDPRAKFSVEDRTAQFQLATKLAQMLNHMSWAVDSVIGVRDQALAFAGNLKPNDPLQRQLKKLADDSDKIRTRIVATKEGGAITGEERLREFLGGLYGDVNRYEGRPTDSQVARADALGRELEDIIREFAALTNQQLPVINRQLQGKKMKSINVISEQEWQKAHSEDEASAANTPKTFERD
jgi:hypothetical protein